MNNTFNVSTDFIIDALQARYDNVKDLWGSHPTRVRGLKHKITHR